MGSDTEYYRRRITEELAAAEQSQSEAAEQCHRRLAQAYSRKLAELAEGV